MIRPVLRRLLLAIPLLFVVSVVTFVIEALTPGNPGRAMLGVNSTVRAVNAIDRQLGFDRPIYLQYWSWLSGVVHGNFGRSVFTDQPVTTILNSGLPVTLTLIAGAVVISLILGVPLGVFSARRRGPVGRSVDVLSVIGYGVPGFWLGFMLVLLFAVKLHWLPPSGWVSPGTSLSGWARSLVLPLATLAASGVASVARQTRDGMLDVLDREFIRALRARGISERSIVYKHALRSAMPIVVTQVGLYVVGLMLGTTLVESVFAFQGLGTIAVQATTQHDLPILEGVALYFTLIVVVTFALVELACAWLNPKLRVHA